MTDRRPPATTPPPHERARRGRREVRLQLRPETAAAIEALATQGGRQAFSDAVNLILERYEKER